MISEKKLEKIEKILGKDMIGDLDAMPVDVLKDHLIFSEQSINETIRELEANPKYQELKESLKALSEGLREVKKRQGAIIQYILHRLEDAGKA